MAEMTPSEMKKREKIVKAMKPSFSDFRKRYGAQAKSVMYATATKQAMKEAVDDEGNMARGQLMRMAKQASSLAMMMDDDKQLDGWVQSKLTMASDYLDSVHDYLMNNVQDVDKMEEENHLCAKHVYSDVFGEGLVLEAEHAEPDEDGNIEWYTVQFDHGKEIVFTEDIKIMHAEMHGNHKMKKKMAEEPVKEMSSKMKMKLGLYNKNEELKGDQHKIDMNKNNKIDAEDFTMLRKLKKARGM